jgi:hypothetical protein
MVLPDRVATMLVSSSALDSVSAALSLPLSGPALGLAGGGLFGSPIAIFRARADSRMLSMRSFDDWFTTLGASRGLAVFAASPGLGGQDMSQVS